MKVELSFQLPIINEAPHHMLKKVMPYKGIMPSLVKGEEPG